jgi:peptidoglycan-associated lipoprotein
MKTKLGLALLFLTALGLAGCATTSKTPAPATGATPATPSAPSGAATGAAPAPEAAKAEPRSDIDPPNEWQVMFGFDSSAIDEASRKILEAHGRYLAANADFKVQLEGHTDERGTREYNLALGERRAQAVEKFLRVLGIGVDRVSLTSYGEEKPLAPEHNEQAWAQNRRVEIIYK